MFVGECAIRKSHNLLKPSDLPNVIKYVIAQLGLRHMSLVSWSLIVSVSILTCFLNGSYPSKKFWNKNLDDLTSKMVPIPPTITDGKENIYLGAQKLNQFVF